MAVILVSVARESIAAGISTDRLSPGQSRIWKSIQSIVFERDKAGRLLHPTLHNLWQQAEASGHKIYIEMPKPKGDFPYTAGTFSVEETGSIDQPRAGVIRLYLHVIDHASASEEDRRRKDGFLQFEKLPNKTLRYAEVLGHELVHALLTLTNLDYSLLAYELERETRELKQYRGNYNWQPLEEETLGRLKRIQSISEKIERSTEETDMRVWRELHAGQRRGAGAGDVSEPGWTALLLKISRAN